MNFKKTKVAVASGLMAASMVLAPLAAYADFSQKAPELASAKIVKTVKVADGVTIDKDVTFKLTQIHNTKDGKGGVEAPNETVTRGSDGEEIYSFTKIEGIETNETTNVVTVVQNTTNEYTVKALTANHKNSDTDNGNTAEDGAYVATTTLDFSKADLKNGVYTFEVEELTDDLTMANRENGDGYGWTVVDAGKKYILTVYKSSDSLKYTIQGEEASGKKKTSADFTNKFTKRGGSNTKNAASLVIRKVVDNTSYYAGQEFTFTISFTSVEDLAEVTEEQVESAVFKDAKGSILTDRTVKKNENDYTFKLANGEYVEFPDIPAGARYTVTETKRTNTSKTNVSTGSNMPAESSTDTIVVKNELITENANQGNFKNYLENITVTGVVTHSAPFVIMVGALFVAVGGYVVLKKRIEG